MTAGFEPLHDDKITTGINCRFCFTEAADLPGSQGVAVMDLPDQVLIRVPIKEFNDSTLSGCNIYHTPVFQKRDEEIYAKTSGRNIVNIIEDIFQGFR